MIIYVLISGTGRFPPMLEIVNISTSYANIVKLRDELRNNAREKMIFDVDYEFIEWEGDLLT